MYELSAWLPLEIKRNDLVLFYGGAQVSNSYEPGQPAEVPTAHNGRWRVYVTVGFIEKKDGGLSLTLEVNGGGDHLKDAYEDALDRLKADGWTWAEAAK